jgi:uncharacterized protein YegL
MNDLKDLVYQTSKVLPVILLLDTSGSMSENGKIEQLNVAVNEMIRSFKDLESTNAQIQVAIYTFGGEATVKSFCRLEPQLSLEIFY